jgi:hypothetical protein
VSTTARATRALDDSRERCRDRPGLLQPLSKRACASHGQAFALALLEVAATHDGPAPVAGGYLPAGLDLVVYVEDAREAGETTADVARRSA